MNQLNYLIENHYPSLKKENIKFSFHERKDCFAYTYKGLNNTWHIKFSINDYNNFTNNQVKGVLSHELAHIYIDVNRGFLRTFIHNLLSSFNSKMITIEERQADQTAINKGCGKYLLEFVKYHDKHYKKYTKKDGLTRKQIKQQLKLKT